MMLSMNPGDYAALLLAETVGGSQDADCKFDNGRYRIWLPRVTDADIEHYGFPIDPAQVEVYSDAGGRWEFGDEADLREAVQAAWRAGVIG